MADQIINPPGVKRPPFSLRPALSQPINPHPIGIGNNIMNGYEFKNNPNPQSNFSPTNAPNPLLISETSYNPNLIQPVNLSSNPNHQHASFTQSQQIYNSQDFRSLSLRDSAFPVQINSNPALIPNNPDFKTGPSGQNPIHYMNQIQQFQVQNQGNLQSLGGFHPQMNQAPQVNRPSLRSIPPQLNNPTKMNKQSLPVQMNLPPPINQSPQINSPPQWNVHSQGFIPPLMNTHPEINPQNQMNLPIQMNSCFIIPPQPDTPNLENMSKPQSQMLKPSLDNIPPRRNTTPLIINSVGSIPPQIYSSHQISQNASGNMPIQMNLGSQVSFPNQMMAPPQINRPSSSNSPLQMNQGHRLAKFGVYKQSNCLDKYKSTQFIINFHLTPQKCSSEVSQSHSALYLLISCLSLISPSSNLLKSKLIQKSSYSKPEHQLI